MKLGRGAAAAAAGAIGLVLGISSLAWACMMTETPYLDNLAPNRGPGGTEVAVHGTNWIPAKAVQLGWSQDGESVTQAFGSAIVRNDTTFAITVRVPASTPGVYYVVATQGSSSAAAAFQVTAERTATSPENGQQSGSASLSMSGAADEESDSSARPASGSRSQPGSSGGSQPASTASSGQGTAPSVASEQGTAPSVASEQGTAAVLPVPARRVSGPAAEPAPAGADRREGPGVQSTEAGATESRSARVGSPSDRSALDDVQAGFDDRSGPAIGLGQVSEYAKPATSPALANALILSVLGVAALFGGFALAETRRRRATRSTT